MFEMEFTQTFMNIYDSINLFFSRYPFWILLFFLILVGLYFSPGHSSSVNTSSTPYYMKSSSSSASSSSSSSSFFSSWSFFEIMLWIVVISLMMIHGLFYFFSLDIKTVFKRIFTHEPELDIVVNTKDKKVPVPEIKYEKQVFHIPYQNYTYEEAKALCKAYGGRLATYEEIEEAYNRGAEWCSYGWSDGQMALYPTQHDTYHKLQNVKGHEHDCGRPGINGGYIENPNIKFGVNCYGYKPKITPEEEELMLKSKPYPLNKKDLKYQQRVDHYKDILSSIKVSPFNYKQWSMPLF